MTRPEPPSHSFASDNVAGAHPRVIEALSAANTGSAVPYGDDAWTQRATRKFRDLFEADVELLFAYGGTGANVVALQSILAPHEAIVCPSTAHINTDECGGGFERFTGAKLIDIPCDDGKLHADAITDLLRPGHGEHHVTPKVLAISQVTELGTVYTLDEIAALAELAHAHGLLLFIDGARIANAAAALGCSLRELTIDAGADVLTFGGTKNGLLYGEGVVYCRPELAARARFARKQAGQLASKMHSSPPSSTRCSQTTCGSTTPATPTAPRPCWLTASRPRQTSKSSEHRRPTRSLRASPSTPSSRSRTGPSSGPGTLRRTWSAG